MVGKRLDDDKSEKTAFHGHWGVTPASTSWVNQVLALLFII